MTETSQRTDVSLLQVTFRDEGAMTLGELADRVQALQMLVLFAEYAGQLETTGAKLVLNQVYADAHDARVARVSYQSPLEVVLALGLGTGVVTAAVNRLLKMYENFKHARAQGAASDLEYEAYRIVREELVRAARAGGRELQADEDDDIVGDAAKALAFVDQMKQLRVLGKA